MRRGSNELEPLARNGEPERMPDSLLRSNSIIASACSSSSSWCVRKDLRCHLLRRIELTLREGPRFTAKII